MNLSLCLVLLVTFLVFVLTNAGDFSNDIELIKLRQLLDNIKNQQNLENGPNPQVIELEVGPGQSIELENSQIINAAPETETSVVWIKANNETTPNSEEKEVPNENVAGEIPVVEEEPDEKEIEKDLWMKLLSDFFEIFENLCTMSNKTAYSIYITENYFKLILDLKNISTDSECSNEVVFDSHTKLGLENALLRTSSLSLPKCFSSSSCLLPNLFERGCNLTYGDLSTLMKNYNEFKFTRSFVFFKRNNNEWIDIFSARNLDPNNLQLNNDLKHKLRELIEYVSLTTYVVDKSLSSFTVALNNLTNYIIDHITLFYQTHERESNLGIIAGKITKQGAQSLMDHLKKILNLEVPDVRDKEEFKRSLDETQYDNNEDVQNLYLITIGKAFDKLREVMTDLTLLVHNSKKNLVRLLLLGNYKNDKDCATAKINNGPTICKYAGKCFMFNPFDAKCLLTYDDINAVMKRFDNFRFGGRFAVDGYNVIDVMEAQSLSHKDPPGKYVRDMFKVKLDGVAKPLTETYFSIKKLVEIIAQNLLDLDEYVLDNIEDLYPTARHLSNNLRIESNEMVDAQMLPL